MNQKERQPSLPRETLPEKRKKSKLSRCLHTFISMREFFILLIPAILYFGIFKYFPIAGTVLAFKNFNNIDGILGSPWVGLKNFEFLFISGKLFSITVNTITYNFIFLITTQVLALIIAVIINEMCGKSYKKVAQSLMFLPYFISYVVLGAFIYNLFNYEHGTLNTILIDLGLEPLDVYSTPKYWPPILTFFNLWKWTGYCSVIYLASASSIPNELYEAAMIDGANIFIRVRRITIPHLVPSFIIVFLLQIGRVMRGNFEHFYNIVGNNPLLYDNTDVIDTFVFRSLVNTFDVGIGTAAGLYQSLFGVVIILLTNKLVKSYKEEYALF